MNEMQTWTVTCALYRTVVCVGLNTLVRALHEMWVYVNLPADKISPLPPKINLDWCHWNFKALTSIRQFEKFRACWFCGILDLYFWQSHSTIFFLTFLAFLYGSLCVTLHCATFLSIIACLKFSSIWCFFWQDWPNSPYVHVKSQLCIFYINLAG